MPIINKNFDNGNPFDFGRTSADYAKYRDVYPPEFYNRLAELKIGVGGQKILDLGTGTGVLPRNMYRFGGQWIGTDISENQIQYAKELSQRAGMEIEYLVSASEALDFPAESFDVVTACQCFMYFDKKIIVPKIHKWLKTNGHLAVLFMAWLPDESAIAAKSEELVLKYNPDWTGAHWQRRTVVEPDWANGFFSLANAVAFDVPVRFTRESWHGRIKSCRGIGASSLTETEIANWEKEHLAYLQTVPEQFDILHYVTILDLKKLN